MKGGDCQSEIDGGGRFCGAGCIHLEEVRFGSLVALAPGEICGYLTSKIDILYFEVLRLRPVMTTCSK